MLIGRENHEDIGPLRHLRNRVNGEALFFSLGARLGAFLEAHSHLDARVAEVEGVSVALRAEAYDANLFRLDHCEIGIVVIKHFRHDELLRFSCVIRLRAVYPPLVLLYGYMSHIEKRLWVCGRRTSPLP